MGQAMGGVLEVLGHGPDEGGEGLLIHVSLLSVTLCDQASVPARGSRFAPSVFQVNASGALRHPSSPFLA